MKVSEVMSPNIVTANINDTILDVAKLMRFHNIGCIPVVENGDNILGVITDRDIVMNMAQYNSDPGNTLAKEIASEVVYKVKPDVDVKYAFELMQKQRIRRLAVVENDTLVGMLSLGDLAVHTNYNMEIGETIIEISQPARVENV